MRAAVYDAYTENFDDITVRELPDPKVPPASVLIEVRAAGVNPVDWKLVGGHLDPVMPTQFPVTPGWDVAGAAGARVIGTASEANHEYLRGLGAEPVTYGDGLVDRVLEAAGGKVDAVADFVGGVLDDTLAVLTDGRSHASVAAPSVAEHGGRYIWVRPDGTETARLGLLVDEGKLTVEVAGTFGLDEVPQAFKDSAAGHVRGKLVIVP